MREACGDNRFEIIKETKEYIIRATNIDTSKDEMEVLDNICFRLWQLGLTKRNLDRLKKMEKIIKTLKPHTHLASGLCEIKLADREISEMHPKYHNNKEVYEPKYYEFYELFTEVLNDNK